MTQQKPTQLSRAEPYAVLNGELVHLEEMDHASQNLLTAPSTHYAPQWFAGSRVLNGNFFRFDRHIQRARYSAGSFGQEIPFSDEEILDQLRTLCERIGKDTLYIRIFGYANSGPLGVRSRSEWSFAMLAMPWGSYFSGSKPFRISTSIKPGNESLPMRSNGERLDGSMLKIGANYARTMLCHQAELGDNEQELIFLDCFGNVAEAGAANLFILRNDGRYLTPPLDSGAVLNGVTRDSAIQLLRHMGKAVIEENFSLETLLKAKAIFTTGTAAGITSVPGIILPGEAFSSYLWDPHDEVNTLAELYEATRMGKVSEFRGWLTAL